MLLLDGCILGGECHVVVRSIIIIAAPFASSSELSHPVGVVARRDRRGNGARFWGGGDYRIVAAAEAAALEDRCGLLFRRYCHSGIRPVGGRSGRHDR